MYDWKEEAKKRKDFIRSHDDTEEETPHYKKKKIEKRVEILFYVSEDCFFFKKGWHFYKRYKKVSDAEKAAEAVRKNDHFFAGRAAKIVDGDGKVIKEYKEIPQLVKKWDGLKGAQRLYKAKEPIEKVEENEQESDRQE